MDRIIWTEEELALFGGALEEDFSFDDGIREAEAFYGSPRSSQHQDRLRAEHNAKEIAISTHKSEQAIVDNTAVDLSYTQTTNHTQSTAQHPHAVKDRLMSPTTNSERQKRSLGFVDGKELSDVAGTGQDTSTLVFRSPAKDTTAVRHSYMSAAFPDSNIETSVGELDPPDTPTESTSSNSSVLLLSPVPRAFASTPKPSENDPPSSIGKNSLIEEMRSEDDAATKDEDEAGEASKDNVPKLELTGLSVIQNFGEDDPSRAPDKISGGPVQNAAPLGVDVDLRIQQLDGTDQERPQLSEMTSANGNKASKSLVKEDVDMVDDEGSMLDTGSATSGTKIPQKRKRPAGSARRGHGVVSKPDAKSKATRKDLPAPPPGPKRRVSDTTTMKAAKGGLVSRELRRLTGSDLLSSSALPQKRGEGRQTRAQKAAEADSVPNAGGAAKTRHRKSGA